MSHLIWQNVAESVTLTKHITLRQAIVDLVRDKEDDPVLVGVSEDEFHTSLVAQNRLSTFTEGCVIEFVAVFLGVDIWLISGQNITESPCTNVSSGRAANAHIVFGYIPGVRFQSLYPTG